MAVMGGVFQLVSIVDPHIKPGGFSTLPSPVRAGLEYVLIGWERKLFCCMLFRSDCFLWEAMVAAMDGGACEAASMSWHSGYSDKVGSAGR